MADALDLGSSGEIRGGSSPPFRTIYFINEVCILETAISKINESESEISFVITPAEYAKSFEKEYKKEISKVSIPGFRKGKTPVNVIQRFFGDSLKYKTAEKVAAEVFFDYADTNEIVYLGKPSIYDFDYKPEENLSFKLKYEHFPELSNLKYSDLDIEVIDWKITEEMVNEEYRLIKEERTTTEPADIVDSIDFTVKCDLILVENTEGIPVPSPHTMDVHLPRSQEEIRTALMGKVVGDEFAFEYTNTHSHNHEDGSSHEHSATYKYSGKVLEIEKLVLPELNEEFFKSISDSEAASEQEFIDLLRADMSNALDAKIKKETIQRISEKLIELNDFSLGEYQFNHYLNLIVDDEIKAQLAKRKKSVKRDVLMKRMEAIATTKIKLFYIEQAILAEINITVSDQLIEQIAKEEAEKYNQDYETILNIYKNKDNLKDILLTDALYDYLIANNNIIKVEKVDAVEMHSHH